MPAALIYAGAPGERRDGDGDGGARPGGAAVEIGVELTGNPGLSRNNPLEHHYRDVLCSRIRSPQNDSVLGAAGRARLGLNPGH